LYRPEQYNPNLVWETMITKNIGLDFGSLITELMVHDLFKKILKI
jgi:iron complex outermembrane receptor protein